MGPAINLIIASPHCLAILAVARDSQGIEEISEPSPLDSHGALNAGLTPEDIKTAFELVTVIFEAGVAFFTFLKAVREALPQDGATVAVAEARTGTPLGRIDTTTSDEDLARMAGL